MDDRFCPRWRRGEDLAVTVRPPHDARPAEYWALVKVMYFGRLHYTETVRVVIGSGE